MAIWERGYPEMVIRAVTFPFAITHPYPQAGIHLSQNARLSAHVDLIPSKFRVVDTVDDILLLNNHTRMVGVYLGCTSLAFLSWNWQSGIVDTIARVDLESRLVGGYVKFDTRVDTPD